MAAGRNLTARFILSLRDGVSAGLGALKARLDGLAAAGRRIGLLGAGVAAISFAGPIASAAAYQDALLQTQITAGGVGPAALLAAAEAGRAFERLALETGQRSAELATAAQNLVAAGLNREEVAAFMPVLARTATATGATLDDLSRTAVALRQNLSITSASEMADALGGMTQAGKAGMFELRDMAREFPVLTANVQALGLSGRVASDSLAAMLQVARRGAGTSAEAATNLNNFLAKITAPETRRNFEQIGVNLEGVLADAARQGINPIEAVLQKIRERTGGNMFRMGELFGDMQVLNFLRPMLQGITEYQEVLEGARAANVGLIDQDFGTRMQGAAMSLALVQERAEQLMRRVGLGSAVVLGPLNQFLGLVQDGLGWMDANYPGVIDQTIGWGASLVVLAGVLGVVVPAVGFLATGFAMMLGPLKLLLLPFRLVLAGVMALGAPLGVAAAAVALLAVALAAAAFNIWRNWDRFAGFFSAMWAGIRGVFGGFIDFVAGVFTGDTRRIVAGLTAMWEGFGAFFGGMWGVVRQSFTDFTGWVDGWTGGALSETVGRIMVLWDLLKGFFSDLWDEVEARFRRFVEWVTGVFQPLIDLLAQLRGATETGGGPAFTPEAQAERRARAGSAGRAAAAAGFYAPEAALAGAGTPPPAELRGRIVIETAPGVTVREAEADNRDVVFEGSRGPVLSRY